MKAINLSIAIVLTLGFAVTELPCAQAGDPSFPDDVVQGLSSRSQGLISMNCGSTDPDGPLSFPCDATVGDLVPVYQVSDAFLNSANPTASLLTPLQSWVAPVLSDGAVVGTITVERLSDGTLSWGAANDWPNGAMAASVPTGGRYINDHLNGAFIVDGTTVEQPLTQAAPSQPHHFTASDVYQTNTATLRDAIKQQRADAVLAGAGTSGGSPIYLPDFVATHGESVGTEHAGGWSTAVNLSVGLGAFVVVGGAFLVWRRHAQMVNEHHE